MHRRFILVLRYCFLLLIMLGTTLQPQSSAYALTTLTVTPLTWNIIGLDSNDVSVGPNHFPIGARVCNAGSEAATNVTATFVWDDGLGLYNGDPYINLRAGTLSTVNLGTLNVGACASNYLDAYFEVQVTRNSNAYNKTRKYHINVTAGNVSGTVSTPQPRVLYVEHLISQSRNTVSDMRLDGVSIAAGGTMTLMVGQTYSIQLVGSTATQGYEQIETFINFPNTIFQVLSVNTTYSAETSANMDAPYDRLYGDACVWENDPGSPNYRACLSTGKAGGNITVTYQVKILQVPGAPLVNPQPLSTLIYDFSGSSFHYNADYGVSTRYANIVNASVTKSFSPKTILPGGNSTLTFTVNNPGPSAISGLNFTDDLPSGMTLANNSVTYNNCGASASPSTVSDPMSFSSIAVAGNGTCTIAVTVTSATNGTYNNTSGNLFLGTTDTGSAATDTLVVTSGAIGGPASCTTRATLAQWNFATDVATVTLGTNVASATASGVGGTFAFAAGTGSPAAGSWSGTGWSTVATPSNTAPYFELTVDAHAYGNIGISYNYNLFNGGIDWGGTNNYGIYYAADGTNFDNSQTGSATKGSWQTGPSYVSGIVTSSSSSKFRLNFWGAKPGGTPIVYLDNVVITGCAQPNPPTLSKSFSAASIGQGNTATLTFNIQNPNGAPNNLSVSEIAFSDVLPAGLSVANGTFSVCGGANNLTTVAATRTIALSTTPALAAGGTCTFNVTVTGSTAGQYHNITTNITSKESGPNTGGANVGYGDANLIVVGAPVISKSFTANPIFTGNTTSLDFDISNPNALTGLTGVTFTDVLPAGLSVAGGTSSVCGGTNNLTTTAATRTITLLNTTIAAGGTCSFSVIVTGSAAGTYTNTTGNVTSTNGGTGNTATANVLVRATSPAINLLKQVGPSATGPWTSFLSRTVGSNVYYRFTVENTGDVDLSNVSVSDLTVSPAACSWTRGDSATAVTSPFTLFVADAGNNHIATCVLGPISAASGLHTNTATASGTNGSTVTKSSSAIYGTPAITLAKSVTETSFSAAGNQLHYSYLVTNSGGAPLLGLVTVADDKATVICPAVSTVGDGDDWLEPADYPVAGTAAESLTCTATYTVTNTDVSNGYVTNIASATISGVTSNSDSETVTGTSNLAITKTDGVTSVNTGGTTTYTIRVTNNGPSSVTGAILSDLVVVGLTKTTVACSAAPGQCTAGTTPGVAQLESGTFALPALASGQFYEITVTATVNATSGNVTNTATVAAPAGGTDPDLTNNTASDTDTVTPVADLVVSKTDGVGSVNASGTTTYTIRVTNNGPSSVTGAVLSDPAITGLTKTSVACSATPGQCVTAPTVAELQGGAFALPALASSQFYEITVNATVTAVSGTVTNNAVITPPAGTTNSGTSCVTGGGITRTFNAGTGACTSSDTDNVTPIIDVSLDKQVSNATPNIGSTVTFTFIVTNAGPSTATNIIVTDIVPTGYAYISPSMTGGNKRDDASPYGAGINWTINSLASGASRTLTYQAVVLGSGTYDNYAEITSHTETDSDSTPGNGQQTPDQDDDDTVTVTPSTVTMNVDKTSSAAGTANPGTQITYTINIENTLTIPMTDIVVTDAVPAGTTFVSGTVSGYRILHDYRDDFASASYSLTTGTENWSANAWTEIGDDGSAASGLISINGSGELYFNDPNGASIERTIGDLSGKTAVFLDIDVRETGSWDSTDTYAVDIWNGSAWQTVSTRTGEFNDPAADTFINISAHVNANTRIRIRTVNVGDGGQDENLYVNYVRIYYAEPFSGALPHAPSSVIQSGDHYFLASSNGVAGSGDDFMTITYVVNVDAAPAVSQINNSASVTSAQIPTAVTDTTSDTIASLNVVKEVSTDNAAWNDTSVTVNVGDTVYYRVRVQNTGSSTLTGLTVDDGMAGCTLTRGADLTGDNDVVFEAGEEWSYTCSITAMAGTNNNTATADSNETPVDSDTASYTGNIVAAPALNVVKEVSTDNSTWNDLSVSVNVGATVYYRVRVTNTGNVTLTGLTVDDGMTGCTLTRGADLTGDNDTDFESGEEWAYTCSVTAVAGTNNNTATANSNEAGPDTDTASYFGNDPSLNIVKEVSADNNTWNDASVSVDVGDTVYYRVRVANTGNITLTGVTVDDGMAACTLTRGLDITGDNDTDFEVGEEWSYTCSITALVDTNNNTASADSNETPQQSDTASYFGRNPDLTIVKSLNSNTDEDGSGTVSLGDTLVYFVTVTNTGNTDLTNLVLNDSLVTPNTFSCTPIGPGVFCVLRGEYEVTQADVDAGQIVNTGSVTDDEVCNPIACTDTHTEPVPQNPSITLAKTGTLNDDDGTPGLSAGDTISYEFMVTNSGNVTLTNITLADTVGGVTITGGPIASLAPGVSDNNTFSGSYTLTQADIDAGTFTNTATVTGTTLNGIDVSDPDDDTQTLTRVPAIAIAKSSNATGTNSAGDILTYTYDIENTGNVSLTNVTVTDAHVGLSAITCTPAQGSSLLPGATMQCSATYTVTQTDVNAGQIDNTGVVTGTPPTGPNVTGNDPLSEPVTQSPAITIVKSSDATGSNGVGDVINYTYDVENTGNVTLTNVNVTDAHGGLSAISCTPVEGSTLQPGETMQCTANYSVTQADVDAGQVDNTGVATGTPPTGPDVSDNDLLTESIARNPAITIVKSSDVAGPIVVNDVITYTYDVENTGNVTLTNVNVTDAHVGLSAITCTPAQGSTLLPGNTIQCTATYTVIQSDIDAGQIDNSGVVTSTSPTGGNVTDNDVLSVPVTQNPALNVVKEVSTDNITWNNVSVSVNVGDTVYYRVRVENTGNTTLTGLMVDDGMAACTLSRGADLTGDNDANFEAGEEWSYTCSVTALAGLNNNTATAISNETPQDSDNASYFGNAPSLVIVKEVSADNATWNNASVTVDLGDNVYFRVRVANTGNITLTGLTVDDGMTTCTLVRDADITGDNDTDFEAGEEWAYTCSITALIGTHNNTATASSNETSQVSASANYVAVAADLELSKTVNDATPPVATNITFTLAVTNLGPDPATGVQVIDLLPSGFTYISDNSSPAAYNSTTGVWVVGDLTAGQTKTLTITVLVNLTGSYTNYAQITASSLVDPDSTPNNASNNEDDDDSVTVTPSQSDPDGFTKTVSDSNQTFTQNPDVAIGEVVEYTLTVNIPPGTFNNAQLVDTMERGLSFMDCTAITDNGLTTSVPGGFTSICSTPTVDDAGGGTPEDVNRRVMFNFGTLTNSTGTDQELVITYRAVVLDVANSVSGTDLANNAVWSSDAGTLPSETETVSVVEPDLSIDKTANVSIVSVGSVVTITLQIRHTSASETDAFDAVVTDTLPAALQYVPNSINCAGDAVDQDADVDCSETAGTIRAEWSNFQLQSGAGRGRVTFQATVLSVPSNGISNTANVAWTSLPGVPTSCPACQPGQQNANVYSTERDYDPASQIDVYGASDTLVLNSPGTPTSTSSARDLPATGFAPDVVTDLSNVLYQAYTATGDVSIEIPSLNIKMPVVGVPKKDGTWNVSWLGNQAGWLEGTAFPSWSGNSVLTSHVYLSNGLPGPFVNLGKLKYGDKIVIYAYGQKYTFEVRENKIVQPDDRSALKHEEKSWLTLITCKEYDPVTNTYRKRVVVRAVLVNVTQE